MGLELKYLPARKGKEVVERAEWVCRRAFSAS